MSSSTDSLAPSPETLMRYIECSGESDNINAKGPMTRDGGVQSASLTKDIAAFCNSSDGGVIVVGKSEQTPGEFKFTGLTPKKPIHTRQLKWRPGLTTGFRQHFASSVIAKTSVERRSSSSPFRSSMTFPRFVSNRSKTQNPKTTSCEKVRSIFVIPMQNQSLWERLTNGERSLALQRRNVAMNFSASSARCSRANHFLNSRQNAEPSTRSLSRSGID